MASQVNLTKAELEEPKTADVFRATVEKLIDRIGSAPDGKQVLRFRKGLAKPLMEEALPLGILSQIYFQGSPAVSIRHVLGNQNYDAEVTDVRTAPAPFKYLEITQAHEGENEHLRMVALENEGHVSIVGSVYKQGTQRTCLSVRVESEFRWHSEILNEELERIRQALLRKKGKTYLPGTGLLILFDDYLPIKKEQDLSAVHAIGVGEATWLREQFVWVGLLGWSGKNFLELTL